VARSEARRRAAAARREAAEMVATREQEREEQAQALAATKIQSQYRGNAARKNAKSAEVPLMGTVDSEDPAGM